MLTEEDLRIIGISVGGSFYREEEDGALLVYGSHTFPSYRITVNRADALRYFDEYFQLYTN